MAAPSAVDYAGLKSWIAQQESYEVAYSRPAPLTSAQQQAIAVLLTPVEHQAVAVLQAPAEYQAVAVLRAPVSPEPDIGNTDWVSALHSRFSSILLASLLFSAYQQCRTS